MDERSRPGFDQPPGPRDAAESIFVYIDELSGASVQATPPTRVCASAAIPSGRVADRGAALADPLGVQAAADAVG